MGNESTHIANACTGEIRIYFQSMKLHIDDISVDISSDTTIKGGVKDNDVEATLKAGKPLHLQPKADTRIQYTRCSPREVSEIEGQGDLYMTITLKHGTTEELLCHNLRVPKNRSLIAIDSGMVKFSKDTNYWMDETGKFW